LRFAVEIGDDPKTIFLNQTAIVERGATDDIRSRLAVERVKAYLESTGMRVELE
jgi:hypothetical protein